MTSRHRIMILKGALLTLWLGVFAVGLWVVFWSGIPLRLIPSLVRRELVTSGAEGPFLVIGAYIASLGIPFPTMSLAVVSGSVYGLFWGSVLAIIGLNICASVGFWIARLFGRHFVETHEHGWIKRFDQKLCANGFITVLFMRLLYFPSDFVSFGCGLSRMPYRQYAFGTFFGSLPTIFSFVLLSQAFAHGPRRVVFGILFVVCVVFALAFRYSRWGKRFFVPPECPSV